MQIFKGIEATRAFIAEEKKLNKRIGLVPTMGALHQGHLRLASKSITENDATIASVFVNPLQFNSPDDLTKYPRTLDQDIKFLEEVGCNAVFVPSVEEMYKRNSPIKLDFGDLDKVLEGKYRPGHFSGVGVIVSKLFNIVQPDAAYFGQKDYQQFLIIKKLIEDLNFAVQLHCVEIMREQDGLAMSSRNQRLSASERSIAPILYQTLSHSAQAITQKPFQQLKTEAEIQFSKSNVRLEYFELADRENLKLLDTFDPSLPSILLIAAHIGEVRLIDNMFV